MIATNVDITAQASLCCQYCAIKGSACMVKVSFKRNKLHMHKIPSSRPEYEQYL